MANQHMINFAELTGATDYAGAGPASLLPFTGDCKVKLLKIDVEDSDSGNGMFNVAQQVDDTFEGKAVSGVLYRRVLINGKDKNGEFNAKRQLSDFLRSVGWTRERIEGLAKSSTVKSAQELAAEIMRSGPGGGAPTAYVQVADNDYKGKISSEVKNYITAERFSQSGGRKSPRVLAPTAVTTNGATATADILSAIA